MIPRLAVNTGVHVGLLPAVNEDRDSTPRCICMSGVELQRGILHARNMPSYRKGSPLEPGLVVRKWRDAHVQGADNTEAAVSDGCNLVPCKPYHGDTTIIADGEAKIFLCKGQGRCFVQREDRSILVTRAALMLLCNPHTCSLLYLVFKAAAV